MKFILLLLTAITLLPQLTHADMQCIDPRDTFSRYNDKVKVHQINNIRSEYYILSYSWAPKHCKSVSAASKQPGKKNYLQCGSGRDFGYILHGLWPQGLKSNIGNYPRACEGDQPKIDREILEQYLCMTPSLWLLQHEYEYHGTCMHDEALEEPDIYFAKAFEMHSEFTFPDRQLPNTKTSIQWWLDHNPHLHRDAIQYYKKGQEWQFCYDNNFKVMTCPKQNRQTRHNANNCPIKGNVSRRGNKYYFLPEHPAYAEVVITVSKGERCFESEEEALDAGWVKVPG